jgi:hypothetical protein
MRPDRWQPLVDLAIPHVPSRWAPAELVATLVGDPWRGPGPARSILNNDGVPLQLCVSSSADRLRLRFIGDPHTAVLDPARRAAASVRSALALLGAAGSEDLRPLIEATLHRTLPVGAARAELRDGALWLAAAVDGEPGVAIYTTLEWGARDAGWARVRSWLDAVVLDSRVAWSWLARLAAVARPVSAAIEGRSRGDARAKIYVRLLRARPLSTLGIEEFAHPSILGFLERTIGERTVPATGLVLSIGFTVATGELADVKVDVCGHCVPRPVADWDRLCAQVTREIGVQSIGITSALSRRDVEVAFIGMGRHRSGEARCNVYLKACG